MLRSANDVTKYTVAATDGELGAVDDLYFDDESWVVRYVVVDTGKWLPGRRVLVSPVSVRQPDWSARRLPVALTREQIKGSPAVDTHQPVSRQHELDYLRYYGYPAYWAGPAVWGVATTPAEVPQASSAMLDVRVSPEDRRLRSCRQVTGYHIHATDGSLGHVYDFLLDDLNWAVQFIVVDTSNLWVGRKVLVAPDWVEFIDWSQREVRVDVTRASLKDAPRYDAVHHVTDQWQADYYRHHNRAPYATLSERARAIKAKHFRPPVITK